VALKITKLKDEFEKVQEIYKKKTGISLISLSSLFESISTYATITLPVRRDGNRVTQDWFNDIRDALIGGVVSPSLTGVVVGNAADVANGDAVYDSIQAAHDASTTTDLINCLARTWVENVDISKEVQINGKGSKSIIDGSVTFATGADRASIRNMYFKEDVTIEAAVIGIIISDCWGDEAKADLVDNSGVTEANFWYIQR
jgi:hypothetical protein